MIARTQAVQAELAALFARELRVEVPSPETDLLATGRLDSVGMVELLVQLEKQFGVRVNVEDLELDHFRTLAAITEFVVTRSQPDREQAVG